MCEKWLGLVSSKKKSNNDSIRNWNGDKGESIEVENSPLKRTRLPPLENGASYFLLLKSLNLKKKELLTVSCFLLSLTFPVFALPPI